MIWASSIIIWADLHGCGGVQETEVSHTHTHTQQTGAWCHSRAAGVRGWSGWLHNRNSIQIKSKRENWLDLTHYPHTVIKAWGWIDAWTLRQEHNFAEAKLVSAHTHSTITSLHMSSLAHIYAQMFARIQHHLERRRQDRQPRVVTNTGEKLNENLACYIKTDSERLHLEFWKVHSMNRQRFLFIETLPKTFHHQRRAFKHKSTLISTSLTIWPWTVLSQTLYSVFFQK